MLFGTAVAVRRMIVSDSFGFDRQGTEHVEVDARVTSWQRIGLLSAQREAGLATRLECPVKSDDAFSRLRRLVEFRQMSQQFCLVGHAADVPADHFLSSQRRLATYPQADQHAGDDRAGDLHFDTVLGMTQQVTTAQLMLEEAEEDLSLPLILPPKTWLLSLSEALVFIVS